jgi:LysR family D-serine deaminase transcriptional activator
MEPLREIRNRLLNGWQLSKMHTFEVAARHQSFALAAEELSLSPSAVSHRINQLEEELGIQLFVRSHRKVELTHEGKRVYWALKSSLDTLNQEILDIKNQELSGTLTLYSRPSIAQCWLVPALGDFTRRYPSISLTVLTGNDNVNLQRAGIDLAIYFDDAPSAQLTHHFLMDEEILPVCSPEYAQRHALTNTVMLIGLDLSGSANNITNFYSDSPHKKDSTPASVTNGGIAFNISGFNNTFNGCRALFHHDDGTKYGKIFNITGTENTFLSSMCSDLSGVEDAGIFVFSGSGTPVNNYVYGGNIQSLYVFPQSVGFNPTINAPCTYTSQIYRHELTQRNVSGRLTISCNITSNVGSGAFSITLPSYLSSFKGDCMGSILTILNSAIRTDTNLLEVNGYITGGKIFFRRIFRSGSPVDVQITDLITGNATIDLSFSCCL